MTERASLRALARAWGVQIAHRDGRGRRCVAADETLVAVLHALGAPIRGPRDAPRCLAAREAELAARAVEPVLVAWNGRLPRTTLRLPRATRRLQGRLLAEDGSERVWGVRPEPAGTAADRRRHLASVDLRDRLPFGAHRLVFEGAGAPVETTVLSAPARAWAPEDAARVWGVFAPLYGLRSRTSLGVGDFGDLQRLADLVCERGGTLVGTLPLLAAFLDEPFEPSPYAPVSRLFWNELYVDVQAVPELADAPAARRLLASDAVRRTIARLRRGRLVDHREAMRLKRRLLEALAAAPLREARRSAFEAFLDGDPHRRDYARFRAAVETTGTTWQGWRGRSRAGRLGERDVDPARARYHAYVQWIAHEQLCGVHVPSDRRPAGLYLDLPLGVHGGGYDTWRERDAFALDVDAGAPPDAFFSRGQSWGFAPLHPERVRARGYDYPRAYLRHHMQTARVLRLDHVMGLHRLYWVPHGADAAAGVYVRYPADEMYALVCLESHRHRCEVVGENLGTVPAAVNAAMSRRRLLRMHVAQFEVDPARTPALAPAPADALACLNTHDMPPFAAWWAARDVDDRVARGLLDAAAAAAERRARAAIRRALVRQLRRAGHLGRGIDAAAVRDACLRFFASNAAPILLVSLEDLWLEEKPQNVPGTAGGASWRRRLRPSLAQMAADGAVRRALTSVDAVRRLRHRARHGR